VVDEVLDCKAAAERRRERSTRCNDQREEEHNYRGLRSTEVLSDMGNKEDSHFTFASARPSIAL
jgi:hypothetical protein